MILIHRQRTVHMSTCSLQHGASLAARHPRGYSTQYNLHSSSGQPRVSSREPRITSGTSQYFRQVKTPPILDAGRTTTPNSTADTDHHQGSSAINGLEEAKLSQDAPGIIVRAGGSAAISSSAASWLVSFASATACMDIESATSTPRDSGYQRATLLLVFSFTNLNDEEPSSLLALLLCQ